MPPEHRPPAPLAWWKTCAAGHASLALLALGALTVLAALGQTQFGTFGQRQWPLPAAAKIKTDGRAYKVKLPSWCTGALAEQRSCLLRTGRPIGTKVPHARTVVERGGGAFKIQRDYLYFSLPRDEDPRPVVHSLALAVPRPVKPVVWLAGSLLLIVGGFMGLHNHHAQRLLATFNRKLAALPASALVGGVFIVALLTTCARLPDAMMFSDGCFSVKGVPYSDATGWDELAANLAQGRGFTGGFSAQRPLYPAMLGLLYAFTGQSLFVAKALNAFWLALAAAAVGALGCAGGSRIAGLAGAAGVLLSEDGASFSKLLLTETSGLAFGVAAVLALALAIESPQWWRIALASLLLACANLSSGFGLLALLGYGAVALVTWWMRHGKKQAIAQSLVLAGIVALAWLPWLVRQHAVHGIWNLSTSSANLMFAAASPEHGQLSVEVGSAWQAAGVPNEEGARYKFYMAQYAEAVKAHPIAYAKTILRGMETFAAFWEFDGPAHFGVTLLGLIGGAVTLLCRQRWWPVLAACAAVIALCFTLRGQTAAVMWPVAAALVGLTCPRRQRPLWALVAVTAPFVAVLAGMTGGNLGRRMWTACEWTMPLLLVMGGLGLMQFIAALLEKAAFRQVSSAAGLSPEVGTPPNPMPRLGTIIGLLLLGHAALASIVTTSLYLLTSSDGTVAPPLPAEDRAHAHRLACQQFDSLTPLPAEDDRLWMQPVQFGEYLCQLDAGEDEQHWARSFQVRPYPRTVAFAQLPGGELIACQLRAKPQAIPRKTPLLLIAVRNHDPAAHLGHDVTMLEVLGWVPFENGTPAWSQATWLPFTREARDIVQSKP